MRFSSDINLRHELISYFSQLIVLDNKLNTFQDQDDIETTVEEQLNLHFIMSTIPEVGLLRKGIVNNLLLFLHSAQYQSVTELNDAFRSFMIAPKSKEPDIKVVEVIADKVYIRIPNVLQKSSDVKQALANYIFFVKILLQKDDQHTYIVVDQDNLGDVCPLSVKTKNAMDELIASARSATGLVGGKTFKFDSGFQCPASGLLVALRTLNKHSPLYKKLAKKPTTSQLLKDSLNSHFGLKEPGVSKFAQLLIKQTFLWATKSNSRLPAGYTACVKSENNCTSSEGIMAKLGFVRINPDVNKVIKVSKMCYRTGENGVVTEVSQPTQDQVMLPHDKHYLSAVKMVLPFLSESPKLNLKTQLSRSDKDLTIKSRGFYLNHSKQVNSYGRAYAFYSACLKNKKKTKPSAVIAACSKAANDSAALPLTDSNGNTYNEYMDLHVSLRRFLEKLLGRHPSPAKRKREIDSESDSEVDDAISEATHAEEMTEASGRPDSEMSQVGS
jgi:hypothetical protein